MSDEDEELFNFDDSPPPPSKHNHKINTNNISNNSPFRPSEKNKTLDSAAPAPFLAYVLMYFAKVIILLVILFQFYSLSL